METGVEECWLRGGDTGATRGLSSVVLAKGSTSGPALPCPAARAWPVAAPGEGGPCAVPTVAVAAGVPCPRNQPWVQEPGMCTQHLRTTDRSSVKDSPTFSWPLSSRVRMTPTEGSQSPLFTE